MCALDLCVLLHCFHIPPRKVDLDRRELQAHVANLARSLHLAMQALDLALQLGEVLLCLSEVDLDLARVAFGLFVRVGEVGQLRAPEEELRRKYTHTAPRLTA